MRRIIIHTDVTAQTKELAGLLHILFPECEISICLKPGQNWQMYNANETHLEKSSSELHMNASGS